MSTFIDKSHAIGNNVASSNQSTEQIARLMKQIEALKAEVKGLERKLIAKEVKEDGGWIMAGRARQHAADVEKRNQWLEQRNAELENPKGSHYASLSWPGKIIFCIKKLKRPLRFQEIMQELEIMEKLNNTESWLEEKTISVTLSNMAKSNRVHSEKMRGTRGNYYALIDWLGDDGRLSEKIKRKMW